MKTKTETLLRTNALTEKENRIVAKACINKDGTRTPRPKFYHDAIVAHAMKITGEK